MEDTGNHTYTTIGNNKYVFTAHKQADLIKVDPLTKSIELRYCEHYNKWHEKNIPQRTFVLNFNMDIITKYNPREESGSMRIDTRTEFDSNTSTCEKLKLVQDNYYNYDAEKLSDCYCNFADFSELKEFVGYKREYHCCAGKYTLSMFDARIYVVSTDNKIISAIVEPDYSLQFGDNYTHVWFINNKHFLIWNDGDVFSVVCIKSNKSKIEK